jgi:pyruvate ferredoxin oxidoreductase gamma subunit
MARAVIEIRFHGRGGQGAVLAAELLAHAAFLDGHIPQSFPFFGVERRGAPVTAFARIDDRPIRVRTSITAPGVVVVLEPGLLETQPVFAGLPPGGLILLNTRRPPEEIAATEGVRRATVDATTIALKEGLGSPTLPIVNTAMLGALAQLTGAVSLAALERAIDEHVPRHPEANRRAARAGFAFARQAAAPASSEVLAQAPIHFSRALPTGPVADLSSETLTTASWRTLRPAIHLDRCTRCNICWKYCPDVAIGFDAHGFPALHDEHCKGCGICAVECPPKAIEMVPGV